MMMEALKWGISMKDDLITTLQWAFGHLVVTPLGYKGNGMVHLQAWPLAYFSSSFQTYFRCFFFMVLLCLSSCSLFLIHSWTMHAVVVQPFSQIVLHIFSLGRLSDLVITTILFITRVKDWLGKVDRNS